MNFNKFVSKHLSAPEGLSGRIISYFMNRQNIPMYRETIKHLQLSGGETVLDIGCGSGYVLNMIAQQHDGIFTGIDLSESILTAAKSRNRQHIESGKMTFTHQDLNAMAFSRESFSHAYTINTVYFWSDPDKTMKEISRILHPGGLFVNTFYSNETLDRIPFTKHGYKQFSKDELTISGENAGFSLEISPILRGKAYCYIYRKRANP